MEKLTNPMWKHGDGVWRDYPPDEQYYYTEVTMFCVRCGFPTNVKAEMDAHECGNYFVTKREFLRLTKKEGGEAPMLDV